MNLIGQPRLGGLNPAHRIQADRAPSKRAFAFGPSVLGVAFMVLMTLGGCVTIGTRTTGAASIEDLNAEDNYIAVYTTQMSALSRGFKLFAPNGDNPGVCNKGGDQTACFDADATVIVDLNAMLEALTQTKVPPRFAEADRLLRDAITKNIQGLDLRNQALANNDNSAWQRHGPLLEQGQASWTAAYAAFPEDNRPALAP